MGNISGITGVVLANGEGLGTGYQSQYDAGTSVYTITYTDDFAINTPSVLVTPVNANIPPAEYNDEAPEDIGVLPVPQVLLSDLHTCQVIFITPHPNRFSFPVLPEFSWGDGNTAAAVNSIGEIVMAMMQTLNPGGGPLFWWGGRFVPVATAFSFAALDVPVPIGEIGRGVPVVGR